MIQYQILLFGNRRIVCQTVKIITNEKALRLNEGITIFQILNQFIRAHTQTDIKPTHTRFFGTIKLKRA